MGAVVLVARLQMRRRIRSLVVIAIVAGLGGGAAIALIAGSRRSATVVDRYFAATNPYTFNLGGSGLSRDELLALPMVERADREAYIGAMHLDGHGNVDGGINGLAIDRGALDPTIRTVAGTRPAAGDSTGVLVNPSFVEQYRLHPGDELRLRTFSHDDLAGVENGRYDPHGPAYTFHITGVAETPADIALDKPVVIGRSSHGSTNQVFIPYDWYAAHGPDFLTFPGGYDVQLRDNRDAPSFEIALQKAAAAKRVDPGSLQPPRFSERRASFTTPVGFETGVLLALGLAIALAAAVVVGLLLRAEQRTHAGEDPALRAIGMTRNRLGGAAALRSVPVAVGSMIVAVGFAYEISGRFPVGVGSHLELDRGLQPNDAVLGIGAIVLVAYVVACAFFLARRPVRTQTNASQSTFASWLNRSGAPSDAVIGAQLAFERGGGGGVPTRSAVAGGALALTVVAAIAVCVASVDNLYASRPAHGWPWDAIVGNVNFVMKDPQLTRLVHDPRFASVTQARYGQATIGTDSTEVLAIDPNGSAPPRATAGRMPRTASEIAVGPKLRERLHAPIGSTVHFSVAGSEFLSGDENAPPPKTTDRDLTVVGEALVPMFGESELAEEAIVTTDAIKAAGGNADPSLVLVTYKHGNARADTIALSRDYTAEMSLDTVPSRIVNLHRVRSLPAAGALVAALLGIVLLAYTLAVGVHARTRELGILRALGMSTRRVASVLAWQGLVIAAMITLVGIPAGALLGIAAWRAMANDLGVSPTPTWSLALLALIPITLAVGLLATVIPARRARHDDVATLLRVE
jgi:hypothetical protein